MRLLPALPKAPTWKAGEIKGMRARGGFVVDFNRQKASLREANITFPIRRELSLSLPANTKLIYESGEILAKNAQMGDESVKIMTSKNKTYRLTRIK
ncbi:glycoside hydrolase family 95-like protein [Echinicola jeungdonensis]|uniref:Glycoside hydrolase family 95-like protein n=1 Tax=Echinicola jeungdonensis TaxID=709343 RepID=A0ABV5J9C7_9BACT